MRRLLIALLALSLVSAPAVAGAGEGETSKRPTLTFNPIVQEWNEDGTPVEDPNRVGWSVLVRRDKRLNALAHIHGLKPGGVYTFWWIVVQEDGTFPDDIFVASGAGKVVGPKGRAAVRLNAHYGQESITGFKPDGVNELQFAPLLDTRNSLVRIEIAYHGQVEDAGDDLDQWLYDFWTGTACPPETPNPNPAQPHCPVYYAATHS